MELVLVILIIAAILRWCFNGMVAALFLFLSTVAVCSHDAGAESLRYEISIVLDDAADKPAADEAIRHAAGIFRNQLGIELVPIYSEVAHVADHTNPDALLSELNMFRWNRPQHNVSDATVLMTRRMLTRRVRGIANVGPACSSVAVAVVMLQADGLDGQVLAHELLHVIGVDHDAVPGWLMSESLAHNGIETVSPDTVLTVKAAPLDCMLAIEPRTATPSSVGEPPTAAVQGGGGAFDVPFILMLLALVAVGLTQEVRVKRLREENAHLDYEVRHSLKELHEHVPPDFCLRDIKGLSTGARVLRVEFTTLAGIIDFEVWLRMQIRRVRHEHAAQRAEGRP